MGHLFALSSGGPEEDVQYVPQHASINRASLRTGGEVAIDSLNWRQLEVYAQYLCQQGFANANLPGPGDRVTITEGKKPNGQGISIKVNGTDLTFQPTTLYAGAGPHVCFKWKVVPTYPPSQSMILPTGNDPAMIKVTLSYARAPAYNAWTDLCAITFRNNPKFSSDLGKLDKINSKFKTKMKETRVAAAYAAAHPRRGNR